LNQLFIKENRLACHSYNNLGILTTISNGVRIANWEQITPCLSWVSGHFKTFLFEKTVIIRLFYYDMVFRVSRQHTVSKLWFQNIIQLSYMLILSLGYLKTWASRFSKCRGFYRTTPCMTDYHARVWFKWVEYRWSNRLFYYIFHSYPVWQGGRKLSVYNVASKSKRIL